MIWFAVASSASRRATYVLSGDLLMLDSSPPAVKGLARWWLIVPAALLLLSTSGPGWAQTYPSRRLMVVVPYTAGSGFDIVARTVGQKLSERTGQPVVIDNKAGASGAIGTEFVANAAPD